MSSIELGSRPPSRSNETQNLQSRPQDYNLQNEEENDDELQSLPSHERTPYNSRLHYQNGSIWSQIWNCKTIKLPIILMFCLYLFDFAPICGIAYYTFKYGEDSSSEKQGPGALRFISANLKADPILDIQIREKGSTCPSGFELFKIGSWPGTVPGCLCDNGDLYVGSCEEIASDKCKKDIPSTFPIAMYEWDDSIWCIKRAILKENYRKEAVCPPEYQECYPGGCFLGDCPITKIEIASRGEVIHKFKNGEKKYLVLTKTKGEPPLINIQITFGEIPCFTQELFVQNIINSSYNLASIKENGCDKYGFNNHLSTEIASQPAFDSFAQNSFPYSVTHLPYFEKNAKTTTAILSSMTRIKTAKNGYCQEINENAINVFSEAWFDYCIFIFLLISVIFFAFRFISICLMLCYLSPSSRAETFKSSSEFIFFTYLLNFICLIAVIIALILYCFVYQKFLALKEYFEGYNSLECFAGSQGQMVINDCLELIREIKESFWVYRVLLISSLLSGLISLRFYIVEKKLGRVGL